MLLQAMLTLSLQLDCKKDKGSVSSNSDQQVELGFVSPCMCSENTKAEKNVVKHQLLSNVFTYIRNYTISDASLEFGSFYVCAVTRLNLYIVTSGDNTT